jgi:hypothetical protein
VVRRSCRGRLGGRWPERVDLVEHLLGLVRWLYPDAEEVARDVLVPHDAATDDN